MSEEILINSTPVQTRVALVESGVLQEIRDLVCEGQSLVVQVVKDPLGSKGARLTTHLSLSSRYLVFMPYTRHVGISQRIEQESERERLRALVESTAAADGGAAPGGFIVRTAAEGVEREGIEGDMRFLVRLWGSLRERIALAGHAA